MEVTQNMRELNRPKPKKTWLLISLCLTVMYISGISYYLSSKTLPTELSGMGDFIAGFLSPLFFLWLITGYFQNNQSIELQAKELRNSIDEMKEANQTSQHQLASIKNTEALNKRDLFFRYMELHTRELDAFAKTICRTLFNKEFTDSVGKYHNGMYTPTLNDSVHMMMCAAKNYHEGKAKGATDLKAIDSIIPEIKAFKDAYESLQKHAKDLDKTKNLLSLISKSAYNGFYKVCIKLIDVHNENYS